MTSERLTNQWYTGMEMRRENKQEQWLLSWVLNKCALAPAAVLGSRETKMVSTLKNLTVSWRDKFSQAP